MSDSIFDEFGFEETIESLKSEVRELYRSDDIPWVVGYSGGKDSTATLQVIWMGLAEMDEEDATGRARAKKRAKDAAEDLEYRQTAIWGEDAEPAEA